MKPNLGTTRHTQTRLLGNHRLENNALAGILPGMVIATGCAAIREAKKPMPCVNSLLAIAALCVTAPALYAAPTYTQDGLMVRPADYREWIFLSSGLDMSYSPAAMTMGHSMFNNVFANPDAYRVFQQTGHWPDGTVLVLELRMAGHAEPPLRQGQYQTPATMGLEAHVRDTSRFKTGWAFFSFDESGPGRKIADGSACESCHEAHAAVDTSFVQFYPTLLPVAEQKRTLSPGFLQDLQAARPK